MRNRSSPALTTKHRPENGGWCSAALMISVSFGMFTAVWKNMANECRRVIRQEEGEPSEREREGERKSGLVFTAQNND